MGPNPQNNDVTGRLEEAPPPGRTGRVGVPPFHFCGLGDNAKGVIMQRLIFSDRRESLVMGEFPTRKRRNCLAEAEAETPL